MSTFGGLNTAYRGLTAAQQAINLAGQNIANSATPGYTRQRIEQSAIGAPGRTGVHPGGAQAGQGVSVDGIARLGNTFLDAGVRNTAAASGYATVRSTEMQRLEDSLQEPGEHGISTALHSFWASHRELPTTLMSPLRRRSCWKPQPRCRRQYRQVTGRWMPSGAGCAAKQPPPSTSSTPLPAA